MKPPKYEFLSCIALALVLSSCGSAQVMTRDQKSAANSTIQDDADARKSERDISLGILMDHLEVRKYELEIKKKTSYDIGFYDGRGELVGGAGGGGLDSGMYTVLISENGNKWSVTIIGNYGAVAKTRGLTPLYNKHIYFRGPADKIILNKWIGKFSLNNNNITSDSIKDGECGLVIMSSDKL